MGLLEILGGCGRFEICSVGFGRRWWLALVFDGVWGGDVEGGEMRCVGGGGGGVETKGLWEMREKSFRDNNVANQKSHLL